VQSVTSDVAPFWLASSSGQVWRRRDVTVTITPTDSTVGVSQVELMGYDIYGNYYSSIPVLQPSNSGERGFQALALFYDNPRTGNDVPIRFQPDARLWKMKNELLVRVLVLGQRGGEVCTTHAFRWLPLEPISWRAAVTSNERSALRSFVTVEAVVVFIVVPLLVLFGAAMGDARDPSVAELIVMAVARVGFWFLPLAIPVSFASMMRSAAREGRELPTREELWRVARIEAVVTLASYVISLTFGGPRTDPADTIPDVPLFAILLSMASVPAGAAAWLARRRILRRRVEQSAP
jgi:hypothetical protein